MTTSLKADKFKWPIMRTFSFEKLNVWQKSRQLSLSVYKTTQNYPDEEKFGLVTQMRRASVSITSNIAEGSSRHSKKDKARFTEIAYGSGLELLSLCALSSDLEFLSEKNYTDIREHLTEILAMLDGLYKSQLNT